MAFLDAILKAFEPLLKISDAIDNRIEGIPKSLTKEQILAKGVTLGQWQTVADKHGPMQADGLVRAWVKFASERHKDFDAYIEFYDRNVLESLQKNGSQMPYQAIQGFTCYNGAHSGLNSHIENQARAGVPNGRRGRDPRHGGTEWNNGTITNDW